MKTSRFAFVEQYLAIMLHEMLSWCKPGPSKRVLLFLNGMGIIIAAKVVVQTREAFLPPLSEPHVDLFPQLLVLVRHHGCRHVLDKLEDLQ